MSLFSSPVSKLVKFQVFNLPPFSRLIVLANGADHTAMASPVDGVTGDPLITDGAGYASGQVLVHPEWTPAISETLKLQFKLFDSTEDKIYASVTADRADEKLPAELGDSVVPAAATRAIQEESSTLNPLTQTFFVPTRYSQGIFITSLELFFAAKDSELPVSIEFRRVIDGLPSAGTVIAGTSVSMPASSVNVPASPSSSIGTSTKFNITPTYFPPGEYAFSVLSNSPNYKLYSGKLGAQILGSNDLVSKEPYTGRLFKTQNTNVWLEETNTDLCFKINKAKFETGVKTFELQTAGMPRTEMDNIYLDAAQYNFGDLTKIAYEVKGRNAGSGVMQSYEAFKEKTPFKLVQRWALESTGDSKVQVTFTNNTPDVTPALDKAATKLYSFKNLIDPYEVDTRNSELKAANGVAKSKYISKIVTLEEGFDSTGLEVKLDVNRKVGTDIDVFCRVISSSDNGRDSSIEARDWRLMPLFNQSANVINQSSISGDVGKKYVGSETEFIPETYKILDEDSTATTGIRNLSYDASVGGVNTTFTSFNKFQVKVVFYSNDTTIVPKIKNLIATAVI
jgi:hypothetical protein